jgi:hypothetical protein
MARRNFDPSGNYFEDVSGKSLEERRAESEKPKPRGFESRVKDRAHRIAQREVGQPDD